ncbi:MAG TPA: WecB/TagA/CpsF family glycosyltransferase, partial [Polyangiaceae bacterium]|nr:WecB/TagA/CpsF family glycosyltransferase [Polyangiaceae bacterium]
MTSASLSIEKRARIHIGQVPIDELTFEQALEAIEALVLAGRGGTVHTPNVDHVVLAEHDGRFRRAYENASLSLVDGMPVLWASHLLGTPLPVKISGSDLLGPLMERAALRGFKVYFLGGDPGVAEAARAKLLAKLPRLCVVGVDSSRVDV